MGHHIFISGRGFPFTWRSTHVCQHTFCEYTGESEPGRRRGQIWSPSLNLPDFIFCKGIVKNELHCVPLHTNCDAVLEPITSGDCMYPILHATSHQERYSLWAECFSCYVWKTFWVWNFDDDIYLLQLGFDPVAAVGKLVQKQERGSCVQKRNNTQNNTNKQNTAENSKQTHETKTNFKKY